MKRLSFSSLFLIIFTFVLAGCSDSSQSGADAGEQGLSGAVRLDGSSTVFPISEAVAEEYLAEQPRVRVTVGVSGTGGGFKKFINQEIDINDASRPIKGKEVALAQKNGIKYLEIPVAYDGISVILSKNL